MKQRIHIDIPDEKGETQCFEKVGGFWSAVGALFAVWRYGKGRIEIGDLDKGTEEKSEEMLIS